MKIKHEAGVRPFMWGIICLLLVGVILFYGLRPKGLGLKNRVNWLPQEKALSFGENGIAFVRQFNGFDEIDKNGQITVEILIKAGNVDTKGFNILLMLHGGSDRQQLVLGQWKKTFILMNGDDYDNHRRLPKIFLKDVFSTTHKRLITITSSDKGTKIFVDGMLSVTKKKLKLFVQKKRDHDLIVLGNSIYTKAGWVGEIYGLAIYGKALSDQEVQSNAHGRIFEEPFNWISHHKPLLLFTFKDKKEEGLVPDASGLNQPLTIPSRPMVLKKRVLSLSWRNIKLDRSLAADIFLNFTGFIPLGMVLFGWLQQLNSMRSRYKLMTTLMFCFMLSFCMEVVQAWIPTRSSSVLDLAMNTLGALFGLLIFIMISKKYQRG